jgi:hypothetical protein
VYTCIFRLKTAGILSALWIENSGYVTLEQDVAGRLFLNGEKGKDDGGVEGGGA